MRHQRQKSRVIATAVSRSLDRATATLAVLLMALLILSVSVARGEVIDGRGAPADGSTLLFIGQDSDTIAKYAAALPEHVPPGVTLYTNITSAVPEETLDGILSFTDRGAGAISFERTLEQFPGAALAIGLSITDAPTCADTHVAKIVSGEYDATVDAFVDYLASLAPRPVFLRIGYEFDGPWNCHRPESFKAAFRVFRERLDARGADHVATVWQSAGWPDSTIAGEHAALYDHRDPEHLANWYPGDDVVDWVSLSIFYNDLSSWSYEPPDVPRRVHESVLSFARERDKPVMIAECAPQGFRNGELTRSTIHGNAPQPSSAAGLWGAWYQPFFDFVDQHRDVVRSVAYINTHWDAQGMWVCEPGIAAGQPGCPNGFWGDTRVEANADILERWKDEISDATRWFQGDVVDKKLYKDPAQPVARRVADLMARMTLEEKVAQVVGLWGDKNSLLDDDARFVPEKAKKEIPHGIGHIARPSDLFGRNERGVDPNRTARSTVELVNAIQKYLLEETRLGIPAIMHEEGLHGFAAFEATHFPQAIALASTWDTALVEEVYTQVAREMRSWGAIHALTPVVDVARDPRWGRIEETYGEDPHLVAEMGLASVRGFQGDFHAAKDKPLAKDRVFSTLKHMTGHGEPENGTNVGPANISERVLREAFFPPFERAVQEAGAMTVMASYNEIDGVPSHVNTWLLEDVLRGEWGFQGLVVADYFAIEQLQTLHHVAESGADAATQALAAGVDVELPNRQMYPNLVELVRSGKAAEADLDRAVSLSLRARFLAGLFEDPYADADLAESVTSNDATRALAQRTAERAVTLLENRDGALPLDASELRRVAVIGPHVHEALLGGYSEMPKYEVSLLDGVRSRVGDDVKVTHATGVRITESRNWHADEVELVSEAENRRLIAEAVKVAKKADVVILGIGDNEQTSREAWADGHLGDRTSLELVGQQEDLVRAILDTGVPTIVVLLHGRPLAVGEVTADAAAVVEAWDPGQEGGTALARVLFGDVNPGGKLPLSIPREVGQLPIFYNHKPSARRGYLFASTEPQWPFGYGLSYTTFEISKPRLDRSTIAPSESTTVTVEVSNTGDRAGDEVVQLYIRDVKSSITRPVQELKGFERVTVEPGETRTVSFTVGPEQLRMWDRSMQRVVEPGEFEIMVGSSSVDVETVTLTVDSE